ncbi:prenyltransferase [Microlunatus sp. Y2014]|uniref:prenyltransferase n=1 Tax=Microlunatus sp. Y2014 TaxID=3418488 RepID=UPI003DA7427C
MTAPAGLRLAGHVVLASRPLSWINTAHPFAVAYLLSTREVDLALVVGTLFFLFPYNLLMYGVNDVFDHASDVANPRKGGAEGAVLPRSVHRATLLAAVGVSVPCVAVLVAFGGPGSWLVLAFSLFAVLAYSVPGLRFKERPFLDSITSSVHFVSPVGYALTLAGAGFTPQMWAVLGGFGAWGIAAHAFGAVQDVIPDRVGGIRSIATQLGAAPTVRFAIGMWTLAGLLMIIAPWPAPLVAPLVVPYVAIAAPYVRLADRDSARANRGWRKFLMINYGVGFLITLLIIWYLLR